MDREVRATHQPRITAAPSKSQGLHAGNGNYSAGGVVDQLAGGSGGRPSSVDDEDLAGHVARGVRGEEQQWAVDLG